MRNIDITSGNLFITSDEHYNHYNIIGLCSRPYSNIQEMNEALVTNHNNVVTEEDITIHLGDFIWKGLKFDDIVYQLNGYHIFVKGNHDHSYPSSKRNYKYEILENQIFEFIYLGKKYVSCHYPLVEWNGSFHNNIHFYGHTHKVAHHHNNAYHVGVDTNNWTPVNIKLI